MLNQSLKTLFSQTEGDAVKMGVEVVHFDANDIPAKRSVMSMEHLLSPLDVEQLSQGSGRG